MTTKELINQYVTAHADNRWMDASELEALLSEFAEKLKAKQVVDIKCEKKSPITGGEMQLMQEKSSVKFRGEEITFIKNFYHCVDSGQDFTDTELDNDNMWAIFRTYWERRGFEHFYDIDGYREEQEPASEDLERCVVEQMEADGDVDNFVRRGIDDIASKYAQLGAQWQKEQLLKDIEQLKAQADKRYDEIDKSGYTVPNPNLMKGTDNIISVEYVNEKNKEHAANLGYYNGMSRAFEVVLGLLNG